MNPNTHIPDEELIDYLLQDHAEWRQIRRHLDACMSCAARAEAIVETLRSFSAEPAPIADVDRNWHALRAHLKPLAAEKQRGLAIAWWRWPALAFGIAAAVLVILGSWRLAHLRGPAASETATAMRRSEPLSAVPYRSNTDAQLESAERLLTTLNHVSGPLDRETRSQAHVLLIQNAACIRSAKEQREFGEAVVLENLGRVLTSIEAARSTPHSVQQLQSEWHTTGLLFELRILEQDKRTQVTQPVEEYQ